MNTVQEYAALAEFPKPLPRYAARPERLVDLDETVARALKFRRELTGLEEHARSAVTRKIANLRKTKIRIMAEKIFGPIPTLSLEPLTWRDKQGWPKLAIVSLDSPKAEFRVTFGHGAWSENFRVETTPILPRIIKSCYEDVIQTLEDMAIEENKNVRLSAAFAGVMPEEVRIKAREAGKVFPKVYVIAEAKRWSLKKKATPRAVDPLLVGFDGGNLYLLDSFDLTSIEWYIKSEFTF